MLLTLGCALVGFVIAWFYKLQLLLWIVEPLVDSFESSPCSKMASPPSYSTRSLFSSYLYVGGTGALLVALPLLGRFVVARLAPGTGAKATSGGRFILASLLAMAVVVASVRPFLRPAVLEHTFPSMVWCSDGRLVEQIEVVNHYVEVAFLATAAAALALELCVVAFVVRRTRATKARA
jgi:Sec-independent protein secretion pathway component TatC